MPYPLFPTALLVGIALFAGALSPQEATAAYPGGAGKVAFESTRTGESEIFVMNADGSGATSVTNDPGGVDTDPVWSPDGTRIAFVKTGEGHRNIWVMNANGTGAENLTPGAVTGTGPTECRFSTGTGIAPTWSPDGTQIAYAAEGDILVIDAGGGDPQSLTCTAPSVAVELSPAWAANGQIAYVRGNDIWSMNAGGGNPHPLMATAAGEQAPDWSPDSGRLVYTRSGQIWTMSANGSAQTAIVSGPGRAGTLPAWSPDGAKIVFESSAFTAPNGPDIFVMNPDGTGVIRLAGSVVPAQDLDPNWQPSATSLPTLSIGDVTVTEGNAGVVAASFDVTLSRTSSQAVTANFATANGTATAPTDFTAASGTLTFAPGQLRKTVAVSVKGDTLVEPAETFSVNLTGSTNATIADTQGIGTIGNDDAQPTATLAAAPATPAPSGGGQADLAAPRLGGLTTRRLRGGRILIRYRLSEPALVTFRLQRRVRRGGRVRYRTLRGSFRRRGRAGANSVRFNGRLAGRRLPKGRYRLVAVARDAAGNRAPATRVTLRLGR